MQYFRTQKLSEAHAQSQLVLQIPDKDALVTSLQSWIQPWVPEHPVQLGSSVLEDVDIQGWIQSRAQTLGGAQLLWETVKRPTYDASLLRARTHDSEGASWDIGRTWDLLREAKAHEPVLLWSFTLPSLKDSWPVPLLFPTWPVISRLNYLPWFLICYHTYKGYLAPWFNLLYPLSTIFGPYIYFRKTLKWNLPLKTYLNFLKMTLTQAMKPSYNLKKDATKYFTAIAYLLLFVYGTIQSFDVAQMIRQMRQGLLEKLKSVKQFVATFHQLVSLIPASAWQPFTQVRTIPRISLPSSDLSAMYAIWTNESSRQSLKDMMNIVYAIDASVSVRQLLASKGWCVPSWARAEAQGATQFFHMGHPALHDAQVRNPAALSKSLIITGPNAAGKTTYVKAICMNMVLAQSLGVVCAKKATVLPVHAMQSFLRVHDLIGKESLFEAEVHRCAKMIHEAKELHQKNMNAIYFLDEPMHSTPPMEGAATAMAVLKYLGSFENIRVILTTHYHHIPRLERESSKFMNISMDAIETKDGRGFQFPYKIRKGPSYQCIALELLEHKDFPPEVIESAIELKNKICRAVVENDARPVESV